jgi:hypothetical protein
MEASAPSASAAARDAAHSERAVAQLQPVRQGQGGAGSLASCNQEKGERWLGDFLGFVEPGRVRRATYDTMSPTLILHG